MTRSGEEKKSAENEHVCEKKKNVGETGKEKSGERREKRKRGRGTGRNTDRGVRELVVVVLVAVKVVHEVAGTRTTTEET
jgi:hypothetical protein